MIGPLLESSVFGTSVSVSAFLRLLLTVLTLACPLNCMGAFQVGSDTSAEDEPVCSTCSCCAPSHSQSKPATPEDDPQPSDDEACPSCFCQGAVLASDDGPLVVNDNQPALLDLVLASHSITGHAPASFHGSHRPPASTSSGSMLRILHQSFLL